MGPANRRRVKNRQADSGCCRRSPFLRAKQRDCVIAKARIRNRAVVARKGRERFHTPKIEQRRFPCSWRNPQSPSLCYRMRQQKQGARPTAGAHRPPSPAERKPTARLRRRLCTVETEVGVFLQEAFVVVEQSHS